MADRLKLEANYRSDMSKSRMKEIRRQGYVTASIFGHGSDPMAVEVKLDDLVEQTRAADAGAKSLIDIKISGAPTKSDGVVVIKNFYKDPLTRKVLDIQFQRINLREKINVGVPVELIGDSIGVKDGGMLDQVIDEIQIHCLPTDIPPRFEVDVSELAIGGIVRAGDVKIEGEIEMLTDPDQVVCSLRAPHVAQAEETAAEEEAAGAAPAETPAAQAEAAGGESAE